MKSSFAAKSVYPSELGLHIEHHSEDEALKAYTHAKNQGMTVRLDGAVMTWQFYNPRKNPPS